MLGSQECSDAWYAGPDAMLKCCPICWTERGCDQTMVLHGLTEFLESIKMSLQQDLQKIRINLNIDFDSVHWHIYSR